MTEAEWAEARHPRAMIHEINRRGPAARKLHLFACACCRRFWQHLPDASRTVLIRSQEAADGPRDEQILDQLCWEANGVCGEVDEWLRGRPSPTWADRARRAGAAAVCYAAVGDPWGGSSYFGELDASENGAQAELLRDIFGN